jgi:glycosyltransferase involved in cell wall biosynthesis
VALNNDTYTTTAYVPAYNVARYLRETLVALQDQTLPFDRIVVIDDGSIDDSSLIAEEMGIPVIRMSRNVGLSAVRNHAIRICKTTHLASVDADVTLAPDWHEKVAASFRRLPDETAGVGGQLVETVNRNSADYWRHLEMRQWWGEHDVPNPPFLFGHSCIYRLSALTTISGYDERFRTNGEDNDLSLRLKAAGLSLFYCAGAKAFHRRRDSRRSIVRTRWNYSAWALNSSNGSTRTVLSFLARMMVQYARVFARHLVTRRWPAAYIDLLALVRAPRMAASHWIKVRKS